MNRLLATAVAVALTMLGAAAARAATTIESLTLFNSQAPTEIWMTEPFTTEWILGVSDAPAGPLLNAPDSSVRGIPQGRYWLFVNPADIGAYPTLTVRLADGTRLSAVFRVAGTNGSGVAWERVAGSPRLELGWADGAIDLVGTTNGTVPDGTLDFYLKATLGTGGAP